MGRANKNYSFYRRSQKNALAGDPPFPPPAAGMSRRWKEKAKKQIFFSAQWGGDFKKKSWPKKFALQLVPSWISSRRLRWKIHEKFVLKFTNEEKWPFFAFLLPLLQSWNYGDAFLKSHCRPAFKVTSRGSKRNNCNRQPFRGCGFGTGNCAKGQGARRARGERGRSYRMENDPLFPEKIIAATLWNTGRLSEPICGKLITSHGETKLYVCQNEKPVDWGEGGKGETGSARFFSNNRPVFANGRSRNKAWVAFFGKRAEIFVDFGPALPSFCRKIEFWSLKQTLRSSSFGPTI